MCVVYVALAQHPIVRMTRVKKIGRNCKVGKEDEVRRICR